MLMATNTDYIYGRVYVDCQRRIFCYTSIPLKRSTHEPIVASERALINLKKSLVAQGYEAHSRASFESQFK
jgi:hypothetical protein